MCTALPLVMVRRAQVKRLSQSVILPDELPSIKRKMQMMISRGCSRWCELGSAAAAELLPAQDPA